MTFEELKEKAEFKKIKVEISSEKITKVLSELISEEEFNAMSDDQFDKWVRLKINSLPIDRFVEIYPSGD